MCQSIGSHGLSIFISPWKDGTYYVHLFVGPSIGPSIIACERKRLKTTCLIDFTFSYGLYTSNTLDSMDLGPSTKNKMTATAVGKLTLYLMQDIACERGSLKTAFGLTSHFDMVFISVIPQTLVI